MKYYQAEIRNDADLYWLAVNDVIQFILDNYKYNKPYIAVRDLHKYNPETGEKLFKVYRGASYVDVNLREKGILKEVIAFFNGTDLSRQLISEILEDALSVISEKYFIFGGEDHPEDWAEHTSTKEVVFGPELANQIKYYEINLGKRGKNEE
jgi:hypothetical protein